MSAKPIQLLPGFRDFYPQECATRNYLFAAWREVCRRHGFLEYEGPVLESTDLYRKKSGEEIVEQLFAFEDKGERDVALRPELTPTLARMVIARQRDFKKPLRWFSIGPFFRYERAQGGKGRQREFYQFNCDILGEESAQADAELVSVAIDVMLQLGFSEEEFAVRLSDRQAWLDFAARAGVTEANTLPFLQVVDKMGREKEEVTAKKLDELGASLAAVRGFIENGAEASPRLTEVLAALKAEGKECYCQIDLSIVRGLAYYTGVVFEIFDKKHGLRAIAGGGRYDGLIKTISDGKADMPAAGFAMGDAVIGNLLELCPEPRARLATHSTDAFAIDCYVVIASESARVHALAGAAKLREAGMRVHYPHTPAKVTKQFQAAELYQASVALVYGEEFPEIGVKNMTSRAEARVQGHDAALAEAKRILADPHPGGLYAGNPIS